MALNHSFLATSFLLLSSLVIASAGDYGYSPKPDTVKPNYSKGPKPKSDTVKVEYQYEHDTKPYLHEPKLDTAKPDTVSPNYGHDPNLKIAKPDLTIPEPEPEPEPDNTKPDYGYDPKPKFPKPDLTMPKPDYEYDSKPKLPKSDMTLPKPETKPSDYDPDSKPKLPKPDSTIPKSETNKPNFEYNSKSKLPKPDLTILKTNINKLHYEYEPKPNHDLPKFTVPKPNIDNQPNYEYGPKQETQIPIGIEGLVLCKMGSKYVPIEGAVVRIACSAVDQNGYEATEFSCLTGATDANGYFIKTLSSFGFDDNKFKLKECKAYLEDSPSDTCKVPTDVNKGITGALLSAYRVLDNKKLKLYSVGPFFYTTESASTPSG